MKSEDWIKEVKRVAQALGLNQEMTYELLSWSINMAFDKLEAAEQLFK